MLMSALPHIENFKSKILAHKATKYTKLLYLCYQTFYLPKVPQIKIQLGSLNNQHDKYFGRKR